MSKKGNKGDQMRALDVTHFLFIAYSAAHNTINAWTRAHNGLFFLFVVVGILSVELILWATYHYWKEGRLAGRMLEVSKWAGIVAMFYAVAGILAQAQMGSSSEWLTFYYQWILPTSSPVMFVFSWLIQASDPVMEAERDARVHARLILVEERREDLDRKKLALDNRRNIRRLKAHVQHQRMALLWKESMSRRSRSLLRKASRLELPILLKSIGVPVEKAAKLKTRLFGNTFLLPPGGDSGMPDHGQIDVAPGVEGKAKRRPTN